MKYFFSAALNGADGASPHSSEAVRHRIKAMIASETGGAVLSDDAIAQRLRLSGVEIARRTVAKYREASAHSLLGPATALPSARQRRLKAVKACITEWKPHHRGQERLRGRTT